jgi:uncharacterized membrane protein HdeD (DUF308 family)
MLADILVNPSRQIALNPHHPMQAISSLVGLVSFVCGIMVLIKLFKEKGALHGILGIISCLIYPFIWGWINAGRLNIKNIMIIWTVCWIASVVLVVAFRPSLPVAPQPE